MAVTLVLLVLVFSAFQSSKSTPCGFPVVKPSTESTVGSMDALANSWPWQVAIFQHSLSGWGQSCGGSLISNQWILTAGHCVYDQPMASKYQVKLGVHNKMNNREDALEVVSSVSEVYLHPEYNRETRTNDVALTKLSVPIRFSDHVSPICLPRAGMPVPSAGSPSIMTGWGLMATGGADSATLRQTTVNVISQDECKLDYPQAFQEKVMLCAGVRLGGKDTCEGDSGGPLVQYDKETQRWTQIGVTSWGDSVCGNPIKPGVYAKVSAFIEWIEKFTVVGYAT